MIDPITNMHGVADEPNKYKRGSTRIYFIFCTRGIAHFIARSGILPFEYITTTDRRGLYIDLQLQLNLKYPLRTINDISSRLLSTSNPNEVNILKFMIKNIQYTFKAEYNNEFEEFLKKNF